MILVISMRNFVSLVISKSDVCDSYEFDEEFGRSCNFEIGFV